jgi:hypothetical protein
MQFSRFTRNLIVSCVSLFPIVAALPTSEVHSRGEGLPEIAKIRRADIDSPGGTRTGVRSDAESASHVTRNMPSAPSYTPVTVDPWIQTRSEHGGGPANNALPAVVNDLSSSPLPSYCGTIGAERYPAPLINEKISIPTIDLERGIPITITTVADEINGDVRTVSSLLQNPGEDGISLREAITATNNDPGSYTIRFSPQMKEAVIKIGPEQLPALQGGNLIIDGDIDGDGKPDVTLRNQVQVIGPYNTFGLVISSSEIVVYALAIREFNVGILIKPLDSNQSYENITISNCQLNTMALGIGLHPGRREEFSSYNRWIGTTIINNIIDGEGDGIGLMLHFSAGDLLKRTTIANNSLRLSRPKTSHSDNMGILLGAGNWPGSEENQIVDALVAANSLEGTIGAGIVIMSGAIGASRNIISNVRITDNRISVKAEPGGEFGPTSSCGIIAVTGDGATDYVDPSFRPIAYPESNRIENIWITNNTVTGTGSDGIQLAAGDLGAKTNEIQRVWILGNTVTDVGYPGVPTNGILISTGGGVNDTTKEPTRENAIADVAVFGNTLRLKPPIVYSSSGGVAILGGAGGGSENNISGIQVAYNDVDPGGVLGINLTGGCGASGDKVSLENQLSRVECWCNIISSPPAANAGPISNLKGVAAIGGMEGAKSNRLVDVHLVDNLVSGILDDYSVVPNLDQDSIGNTIQLSDAAIVSPALVSFPSSGGTESSSVLTQAGRPWTSASNTSWITLISSGIGIGNGTVSYSVEPNSSDSSREGTLTIADRTVTVIQDASSPEPTITGLSPASATAGGAAFTLTVNGTNFVNTSTVNWNGSSRTTTFVSSTQLTAAIPAADITAAGTVSVTVVNPWPGSGTSNAQTFAINNPASTLTLAVGMGRFGTNGGWVSTHAGKDGGFALQSWLHLSWDPSNATGGGVHVAVGDVDGDGLDEIVLGLGTGGGGWIAILDDSAHNNVLLKWIQVNWNEYNTSNGEVFPAVGDIDGDGRAEIIAGLGTGSQGWVEIFGNASSAYQHMAWRQVAWPAYNAADGTTHPAVGDLDGDGKAEIVLGLGSGGGGWIEVLQSSAGGYNHESWFQVNWPDYNASNGTTWPAVGDIDGDGRAEIVIGLGLGSGGWVEFLDDKAAGYVHLKWFQLPWDAYDSANGETHPAVGNLDADSRAEIVFGLGRFQGHGGWLFALDDATTSNYATLGWFQIPWNAFSQDGGETFPAVGRPR